jgi:hypothetical protein
MLSNKLKLVTDPITEDVLLLPNLMERRADSPHVIAFYCLHTYTLRPRLRLLQRFALLQ